MIYLDDLSYVGCLAASAAPLAYAVVMGAHASVDARFERIEGPTNGAIVVAVCLVVVAAMMGAGGAVASLAMSAVAVALTLRWVWQLDGARVRPRPGGVRLQARSSAVHAAVELVVMDSVDLTLIGMLLHAVAVVPVVLFAWGFAERGSALARPLPDPVAWGPGELEALQRRDEARARAMDAPADDSVRRGAPKVRPFDDRS